MKYDFLVFSGTVFTYYSNFECIDTDIYIIASEESTFLIWLNISHWQLCMFYYTSTLYILSP